MKQRSATLVVATLLLAGCSSNGSTSGAEDPLTGVDLSGVSEAQAAEISDRKVTEDEYHAAFQRFRECLSAAGFELENVEFTGDMYEARMPDAAVQDGADAECYDREYTYTDMLWQGARASQPDSEHAQFLRECLQEHGLEPADSVSEMDQQLREAGFEPPECL